MRNHTWQATAPAEPIVVQTPAKLNLFLEILSRRADGYHELETLMVPVSIRDTLVFVPSLQGEIQFSCRWAAGWEARRKSWTRDFGQPGRGAVVGESTIGDSAGETPWEPLPAGPDNLVVRALERFREAAGTARGADVLLVKRIPAAAGLGGASSDAAAALAAANQAWQVGWSLEQLRELAGTLGSDIPFFFGTSPARCRGRGEQLETLAGLPVLHFVVVRPPEGLSTAAVYRECQPAERPRNAQALLDAWRAGDRRQVGKLFHNRLQEAAERLSPAVARLQAAFRGCGVLGHQMSGSGTSYFGLCHHARHARQVAGWLQSQGLGAVFCASTDRSFASGMA